MVTRFWGACFKHTSYRHLYTCSIFATVAQSHIPTYTGLEEINSFSRPVHVTFFTLYIGNYLKDYYYIFQNKVLFRIAAWRCYFVLCGISAVRLFVFSYDVVGKTGIV